MLAKAEPSAPPQSKRTPPRLKTAKPSTGAEPKAAAGKRPRYQSPDRQGRDAEPTAPFVDVASELDEDRKPALHTGGDVLIKDATILDRDQGTIAKGSILVEDGKIKAVGAGRDGA